MDPLSFKELYHQASSLKQQNNFTAATALFTQVSSLSSENNLKAGALFHLGEMAFLENRHTEAKKLFFKCLALNKGHGRAREILEECGLSGSEEDKLKKILYFDDELDVYSDIFGAVTMANSFLIRVVLERFFAPATGAAYGLTRERKEALVKQFRANETHVPCATSWLYHLILATELFRIPPDQTGDVIECGVWKGGSTVNLSLACQIVGRKLLVCDSFAGLPQDEVGQNHLYPHLQVYGYYQQGMYSGPLEEVRANLKTYGHLPSCTFIPGYFNESLPQLTDPIAFAFLDVDLASSLRDCIQYIWPLLIEGGLIYTDDSCDMAAVKVWFDDPWWQAHLNIPAPGYVGSGCGLPLNANLSSLGYTRKISNPTQHYQRISWLYYPDES